MSRRWAIAAEVMVNFVLPLLLYHGARPRWGEGGALIVSTAPPILWSAWILMTRRRMDAISLLVIAGILLSLGAVALGGTPRLLLLRESLITGIVGILLLVSLFLPRPLMFYLARATASEHTPDEPDFDALWARPIFVRCMYRLTSVWGVLLLLETLLRWFLVWNLAIEQFLIVSPIISYGLYAGLISWTLWYARKQRKLDVAKRSE